MIFLQLVKQLTVYVFTISRMSKPFDDKTNEQNILSASNRDTDKEICGSSLVTKEKHAEKHTETTADDCEKEKETFRYTFSTAHA